MPTEVSPEVWKQMTDEEAQELAMRGLAGHITYTPDGKLDMILMGSHSMNRLIDYVAEMNKKYGRKEDAGTGPHLIHGARARVETRLSGVQSPTGLDIATEIQNHKPNLKRMTTSPALENLPRLCFNLLALEGQRNGAKDKRLRAELTTQVRLAKVAMAECLKRLEKDGFKPRDTQEIPDTDSDFGPPTEIKALHDFAKGKLHDPEFRDKLKVELNGIGVAGQDAEMIYMIHFQRA